MRRDCEAVPPLSSPAQAVSSIPETSAKNRNSGYGSPGQAGCIRNGARIGATRWLAMTDSSTTVDNSGRTGLTFAAPDRYINPARHVRAFGVWIGIENMTGSTRSSGGLDDRRKRLLFRCWHRGTREMDLILGRFADAEIANLADDELAQLEHLIEVPDPDLYAALTGDGAACAGICERPVRPHQVVSRDGSRRMKPARTIARRIARARPAR